MSLKGIFLFLFTLSQLENIYGLECHNCFAKSRDLEDCHPLSIEKLREKLRENEKFGRGPHIKVEEYEPDACVIVDVELMDQTQNKVIDVVVVRTQVRRGDTKLFEGDKDKKLTEKCKIKNEIETKKQYSFITKYCACSGDYCNQSSGLRSPGFYNVLLGVMSVILFFGEMSTRVL